MATITVMAPGWEEKVKVAAFPFLNNAAKDIADDIRQNLVQARNVKTGRLYRSVTHVGTAVKVGTDHWEFIEFGTERHIIRARRKKVLASPFKVFGPMVRHPGNRAYAPIRRAIYKKRRLHKF